MWILEYLGGKSQSVLDPIDSSLFSSLAMDSIDVKVAAAAPSVPKTQSTFGLDPEYWDATKDNDLAGMEIPVMKTGQDLRAFGNPLLKAGFVKECSAFPVPDDPVTETKVEVPTFDGAQITVSRFAQAKHRAALPEGEPPRPAVYCIHGGGMVSGSVEIYAPQFCRNAAMWDVQIFAVGYRVAPESPAPGPVEDAWAGLQWLSQHAASMGVDPARIVLYGDSAGGGIAAGTALLARDRKLAPPVAKQVLIYPMLDDRTHYGADWPVRPFLGWSEKDNEIGWAAYVGADKAGKKEADVSIYAAPGRATTEELVGLPKTYMDTAGLDLFCGEDLGYATKLLEAHVEVEFHLYPGVPHGFEPSVTPRVVKTAYENRTRAIRAV